MKEYLIGFSIAVILAGLFYFFHLVPLEDKAYLEGYSDCEKEIDTVFVPGDTVIVIEEKTIYVEKPVQVEQVNDSVYFAETSIDTTFKSGRDEINVQAIVGTEININDLAGSVSEWYIDLVHRDFDIQPDTLKIYVPKYIEMVEKETNWFLIFISYLAGGITALLALIL